LKKRTKKLFHLCGSQRLDLLPEIQVVRSANGKSLFASFSSEKEDPSFNLTLNPIQVQGPRQTQEAGPWA
jgi:hypothetical protein